MTNGVEWDDNKRIMNNNEDWLMKWLINKENCRQ